MQKQYQFITRPNPYQHITDSIHTLQITLLSFPLILPCLMAAVAWLGTLMMYGKGDTELTWMLSLGGLGASLLLLLIFFPVVCIKRTKTPSRWQRFWRFFMFHIAKYILFVFFFPMSLLFWLTISTKNSKQRQKQINTYIKYWLSHPGEEPTQEQCEQIVQADTTLFDWQNPAAWPDVNELQIKEII